MVDDGVTPADEWATGPDTDGQRRRSFRPRARLLRTFGDELISSETVAIVELVKNAYDADARRVLIRFVPPLEEGAGGIDVVDDGHGMTLATVEFSWMEPATSFRRQAPRSEDLGRRVLGEKGIGRFAASKLADHLELTTRRDGAARETRVALDWTQFDDQDLYLDQVQATIDESDPSVFAPNGEAAIALAELEPSLEQRPHGTVLRMTRLRSGWSDNELVELRSALSRLISPFTPTDAVEGDFRIHLVLPEPFDRLSGPVRPPETLSHPHYSIKGAISTDGDYALSVQLRGREEPERITGRFELGHQPSVGPFDIEIRAWDRDQASIAELAQERGATLRDVRRDLNQVAGINIYRDGFRVLPYGEPQNDWLRLDLRRVQNPTLRLSNNQIVGYVLISADANPALRDQSNREGLIDGPPFADLGDLVKHVLAQLEVRRYSVRRTAAAPTGGAGILSGFDLGAVRQAVVDRHPTDTDLLALIDRTAEDFDRRVGEVQEVLGRFRRLSTLGQLIDSVLHDGRTPLASIGNETRLALRDIERSAEANHGLIPALQGRLQAIRDQAEVLGGVFRRIEPFGGRRRGRPSPVRLEAVIADAFAVLGDAVHEGGIEISLPQGETVVTADAGELQEVIVNLLLNSLYWLRSVPAGSRSIEVSVRRLHDEVEITFSDSGPGVPDEFREHIFDPYFSQRPDGVGLGLTIVGEIVHDYYAGDVALVDSGPLPGATFRITLRRRIE